MKTRIVVLLLVSSCLFGGCIHTGQSVRRSYHREVRYITFSSVEDEIAWKRQRLAEKRELARIRYEQNQIDRNLAQSRFNFCQSFHMTDVEGKWRAGCSITTAEAFYLKMNGVIR